MTQAFRLPPVSILPKDDARFLAAARDIATLSDGVLTMTDSPLLAIALPSDRRGVDELLTLWCQRLEPCIERRAFVLDTPVMQPVLDALCLAVDALFDRLSLWGWDEADAPGLGIVTDGVGVALTTQFPTPESGPAWLLGLAEGDAAASPVLPFGSDGVWSLLVSAQSGASH